MIVEVHLDFSKLKDDEQLKATDIYERKLYNSNPFTDSIMKNFQYTVYFDYDNFGETPETRDTYVLAIKIEQKNKLPYAFSIADHVLISVNEDNGDAFIAAGKSGDNYKMTALYKITDLVGNRQYSMSLNFNNIGVKHLTLNGSEFYELWKHAIDFWKNPETYISRLVIVAKDKHVYVYAYPLIIKDEKRDIGTIYGVEF